MRFPARLRCLAWTMALCAWAGCTPGKPSEQSPPTQPQAARAADAKPAAAAPSAPARTPAQLAELAKGSELYGRMCAVCHGANGEGYKADQATALNHPEFLASVTDSFLHTAIAGGRQGTTMSAWAKVYGGPLEVADVAALVALIRSWQTLPRATLDERPLQGDPITGQALYERECVRCHGALGRGGPNVHIGNPQLLNAASPGYLRHAVRLGRKGTAMPGYTASLGDQGVEDVVAYVMTLRRNANAQAERPAPSRPPPIPLGPVPLNRKGPDPIGFNAFPGTTKAQVIHAQLVRGARMALLDARAPSDYANEHITGAVSVPFYDPSPYLDKLPKDSWLVAYCACPHAESSSLAKKLQDAGFKKVTVLEEGLGFWKAQNFGTHAGQEPGKRNDRKPR